MAVEFALIAPLLIMLVFGIIEIGRFVMVAQMVTGASRQGCRIAVLSNASRAQVVDEVQRYLAGAAIPAEAVTVVITGQTAPDGDANQAIDLATIDQGLAVRINVQVDYEQVTWISNGFFDLPDVAVATVMRKEAH